METKEQEIVLSTDDNAATYRENIKGWVSRSGRFYGNDERLARWDGCTHVICETCGNKVERNRIRCDSCQSQMEWDRYNKLEKKVWDYKTPLYSKAMDKYFWDDGELNDYIEDQDEEIEDADKIKIENLQLVICEPEYAHEIEPNEIYGEMLPEDMDLVDVLPELDKAFEELNIIIRQLKKDGQSISWMPGKYVPIFEKEKMENKQEVITF